MHCTDSTGNHRDAQYIPLSDRISDMKILHLLPGFALDYPGGITNYVRSLAKSQIKHGNAVATLTDSCAPEVLPEGMQLIQVGHNKLTNFSYHVPHQDYHLGLALDKARRFKPDVVHVHTIYGLSSSFIDNLLKLPAKTVISLHDYYLACPRIFMMDKWGQVCRSVQLDKCSRCVGMLEQSNPVRLLAQKFKLNLPTIRSSSAFKRHSYFQRVMNNSAAMLPVSHRVEDIFRNLYPLARYTTLNIGNDSAALPPPLKTRHGRIRVCFLGTLNRHKGGDLFLEMVDHCARVGAPLEFHFYGRAAAEYEARLTAYGVINHGAYHPRDMPTIMANTDLGAVLPIWEDNGPQVVMEIINSRTPIIATRVGGIPDFVTPDTGMLFHPDLDDEKKVAFDWLARLNHATLDVMASNIRTLLTPEQHCEQLARIYAQVLDA